MRAPPQYPKLDHFSIETYGKWEFWESTMTEIEKETPSSVAFPGASLLQNLVEHGLQQLTLAVCHLEGANEEAQHVLQRYSDQKRGPEILQKRHRDWS